MSNNNNKGKDNNNSNSNNINNNNQNQGQGNNEPKTYNAVDRVNFLNRLETALKMQKLSLLKLIMS